MLRPPPRRFKPWHQTGPISRHGGDYVDFFINPAVARRAAGHKKSRVTDFSMSNRCRYGGEPTSYFQPDGHGFEPRRRPQKYAALAQLVEHLASKRLV
jgi:hypothetical protein